MAAQWGIAKTDISVSERHITLCMWGNVHYMHEMFLLCKNVQNYTQKQQKQTSAALWGEARAATTCSQVMCDTTCFSGYSDNDWKPFLVNLSINIYNVLVPIFKVTETHAMHDSTAVTSATNQ